MQRDNYIRVATKFGLEDPPKWWLKRLHVFDDQLVLFASQSDPVFRLGRKSRLSRGIEPADVPGVANHPDTIVMRTHGLVPVTTVYPRAIWDETVFEHLAQRDTWRMGGAEGTMQKLEELDQAAAAAIQKKQDDELHERSVDAFAAYRYRTGSRVSMAHSGSAVNRRTAKPQIFDRKTRSNSPALGVALA